MILMPFIGSPPEYYRRSTLDLSLGRTHLGRKNTDPFSVFKLYANMSKKSALRMLPRSVTELHFLDERLESEAFRKHLTRSAGSQKPSDARPTIGLHA